MTPVERATARVLDRMPELAFDPGLLALVDQHVAHVRDLTDNYYLLSHYARGYLDSLDMSGYSGISGENDTATLRLMAIAYVAKTELWS